MSRTVRFSMGRKPREFVFGGLINVPLTYFLSANTVTIVTTHSQKIHLKTQLPRAVFQFQIVNFTTPVYRLVLENRFGTVAIRFSESLANLLAAPFKLTPLLS